MMTRLLFLLLPMAIFQQGFSQTGCTNAYACNYDPEATIENGSCFLPQLMVPIINNLSGFVVPYCEGDEIIPELPMNYGYTEFSCVWSTINNDPFCIETIWDGACTSAYLACCGDQTVHIPAGVSLDKPAFGCGSLQEHFYPANQDCVQQVIQENSSCMLVGWSQPCVTAYHECAHGCADAVIMIPQPGVSGLPGIVACQNPGFAQYMYANQQCAYTVAYNNPSCVNSVWTAQCQNEYLACCSEGTWYIPNPITSSTYNGPATSRCGFFGQGITVSPFCVQSVPFSQSSCISVSWTSDCDEWYYTCTYGCANPMVYLPVYPSPPGPAVLSCSGAPSGYELANQSCAFQTLFFNPWCFETSWLSSCQQEYSGCTLGCTYPDACNYAIVATRDDGSCVFQGCIDADALNYDPAAGCDDGSCIYGSGASCAGDLNDDGLINATDLLLFLSVFATTC